MDAVSVARSFGPASGVAPRWSTWSTCVAMPRRDHGRKLYSGSSKANLHPRDDLEAAPVGGHVRKSLLGVGASEQHGLGHRARPLRRVGASESLAVTAKSGSVTAAAAARCPPR